MRQPNFTKSSLLQFKNQTGKRVKTPRFGNGGEYRLCDLLTLATLVVKSKN